MKLGINQKLMPELPKEYITYWRDAIYRTQPREDWQALILHDGQCRKISLETTDRGAAAIRARNAYMSILTNGWDRTLDAIQAGGWEQFPISLKPERRSRHACLAQDKGACKVPDCGRPALNDSGLCRTHYYRWRRCGDVQADVPIKKQSVRTKCKIPDCSRLSYGQGFCSSHLYRWVKYGDPLHVRKKVSRKCQVPGCSRKAFARDFCSRHYAHWRKYGDPLHVRQKVNRKCQLSDCDQKSRARGFCVYHYHRWYRGELAAEPPEVS